jgi:hypothetical protein
MSRPFVMPFVLSEQGQRSLAVLIEDSRRLCRETAELVTRAGEAIRLSRAVLAHLPLTGSLPHLAKA